MKASQMSIKISDLYIYPLKSGQRIKSDKLEITLKGPKHDREWMIIRDGEENKGKFITQRDRDCEKIGLIKVIPSENSTKFIIPDQIELDIQDADLQRYSGTVRVWKDECEALDAGDKLAELISQYLDQECRIVKIPDNFSRKIKGEDENSKNSVSFADGFPLLITNETSLSELSKHMPADIEVNMDRFRPNIVLRGIKPFEEDVINQLKIGEIIFELVKPCSRCKITTIDQDNLQQLSMEPLQSLTKLRRGSADGLQGVFFGQNAIPRNSGIIRVGDEVEIISNQNQHPALEQAKLNYNNLKQEIN